MTKSIRVGVVDQYPLFRAGVICALEAQADIEVVGQGASAADAIRMARESEPDVIVLDTSLLDGRPDAIAAITEQHPAVRVLVLTAAADQEQVCTMLKSGARGYLLKGTSSAELVQAVRVLNQGESYVAPSLAGKLLMHSGLSGADIVPPKKSLTGLTPREVQILSILSNGRSNKEIGNKLALSEKTVKHHVTNILHKLQVRNRVEAALLVSERLPQASRPTLS